MDNVFYDGLEWEIGSAVGSSTPDDQIEIQYSASALTTKGNVVDGTAIYRGYDDSTLDFYCVLYDEGELDSEDDDDDEF